MQRLIVVGFAVGLLATACAKSQPSADGKTSPSPTPSTKPTTPAPTTPPTSPSPQRPRTYTVQPRDTLSAIGRRFGVPWEEVAALNGIAAPYVIFAGQVLRIPWPGEPIPPLPTPSTSEGLPRSLVGTQWYRLPTSRKVVALTFDAGADNAGVSSILAMLKSNGVPATFFIVGKWAELYPKDARTIAASYVIGNHTYSHPDLTKVSDAAIRSELDRGEEALIDETGQNPRPLFRFPYGAASQHAIDVVNSVGYGCINWTVGSRGWMGSSGGETVDSVAEQVLGGLEPGAIILMHVGANPDDRSTLDADALPRVIEGIRARGYAFVTIDQYL